MGFQDTLHPLSVMVSQTNGSPLGYTQPSQFSQLVRRLTSLSLGMALATALSVGCVLPHANPRDAALSDATTIDIAACPEGTIFCGGTCTSLLTDPIHCGRCDISCNFAHASSVCNNGECALGMCDPGWGNCNAQASDGCEQQLNTNTNCGMCGRACTGQTPNCDARTGTCGNGCPAGQTPCDASCVDTQTDVANCGACGAACALPHASAMQCSGGQCGVVRCDAGYADCDGVASNGCETALGTDENCAGCRMPCAAPTPSCNPMTLRCESNCIAPARECPGFAGCIDIQTNENHCGGCGIRCNLPNAVGRCVGGQCQIASCAQGFQNCDGMIGNGCERNVTADPNNCGACRRQCNFPQAMAVCRASACVITGCSPGFANCDGLPNNGCESSLGTVDHCGSCNNNCSSVANATPRCSSGSCGIMGVCNAPFANCDGNESNGCETNPNTSVDHCGGCGQTCTPGNVMSRSCVGGMCTFSGCLGGFADCDLMGRNGCEVNTSNDAANCGSCNMRCPGATNASGTCNASRCSIACNPGFANCDGSMANGCEVDTNTAVGNCGRCGTVCPVPANATAATCAMGRCGFTCAAGSDNCDGAAANGCEVDINTNANCGRCGVRCTGMASCNNGTCECPGGNTPCGMNPVTCCTPMQMCMNGRCM